MDSRKRKKVFLAALEIWELSRHATACGMSRKLNELAEFVEDGGKLQSGALFVTAARGSNHTWLDWAVDFLGCLPKDQQQRRKIYLAYKGEGEHDCWAERRFWGEVAERKLDKAGLLIARRM
jgi:hypothetical protein